MAVAAKSIHSDLYRDITAALAAARKKAGLTQQEVARRLGRPQSYVAKIENNERRLDVVEFLALARAIGFSYAKFLAKIEKMMP
jgi:transcriptional regulator with XRE-family HTH domain